MRSRHPSAYPGLSPTQITLVSKIITFTRQWFENPKFDSSHDFQHVVRVTNNAMHILDLEQACRKSKSLPPLSPIIIILAALLHDVDDAKYTPPLDRSEFMDPSREETSGAKAALLHFGACERLVEEVHMVICNVSYSWECRNPKAVAFALEKMPELAVVQDSDRLDAIGAIGIGRCFTFGGAKGSNKGLGNAIEHCEEKLLKLEGMMKTRTGVEMAATRSSRIREYMSWWVDEGGPTKALAAGGEDEWQ